MDLSPKPKHRNHEPYKPSKPSPRDSEPGRRASGVGAAYGGPPGGGSGFGGSGFDGLGFRVQGSGFWVLGYGLRRVLGLRNCL